MGSSIHRITSRLGWRLILIFLIIGVRVMLMDVLLDRFTNFRELVLPDDIWILVRHLVRLVFSIPFLLNTLIKLTQLIFPFLCFLCLLIILQELIKIGVSHFFFLRLRLFGRLLLIFLSEQALLDWCHKGPEEDGGNNDDSQSGGDDIISIFKQVAIA